MSDEGAQDVEEHFGSATIKDTCGVKGCGQQAFAVQGVRSKEEGAGFFWLCEEHARRGTSDPLMPIAEIARTCGKEVGGVPCGAVATHVLLLGYRVDGRPHLGVVSVCERHADRGTP